MSRLLRFWSLDRREKRLFFEAALLVLLSFLGVKTIAFRRIDNFLRTRWNYDAQKAGGAIEDKAGDAIEDIELTRRSLERVVNALPWKNLCLSQSIAGFVMLRRRGIPVALVAGVRSAEDSSLHAHAWIETGQAEPNTNSKNSAFTPVLRIGKGR
jgi:hypothetical protein